MKAALEYRVNLADVSNLQFDKEVPAVPALKEVEENVSADAAPEAEENDDSAGDADADEETEE